MQGQMRLLSWQLGRCGGCVRRLLRRASRSGMAGALTCAFARTAPAEVLLMPHSPHGPISKWNLKV